MSIDFSKFNSSFNGVDFNKHLEEEKAKNIPVPNGKYVVTIDDIEMKLSKTQKLMVTITAKIQDDNNFNGRCIFFNRVISGTKNDISMISSLLSIFDDIQPDVKHTIQDSTRVYNEISEMIANLKEDSKGFIYTVIYNEEAFNSITFVEED